MGTQRFANSSVRELLEPHEHPVSITCSSGVCEPLLALNHVRLDVLMEFTSRNLGAQYIPVAF